MLTATKNTAENKMKFIVHSCQCIVFSTLLALVLCRCCHLKLPWQKFPWWPMEAAGNYFGVPRMYLFKLVF